MPRRIREFIALPAVMMAGAIMLGFAQIDAGMAQDAYFKGQFLVAAPSMPDPRFKHTVIYMVEHDEDGAIGLVVNRLIGTSEIAKLLTGFGIDTKSVSGDIPVFYGGPVQPEIGFVLHSADYDSEHTVVVRDKVAVTQDPGVLRAIGVGKGPNQSLFVLGYAGWAPRQLEGELEREDWVVVPADTSILFDGDLDTKWERAIALRGIDL